VGARLPHLRWLWIGLFVGAGLALVVGAVLVVLAVRRRPSI
jgi:ABC-type transporter Mla subunit MlaD